VLFPKKRVNDSIMKCIFDNLYTFTVKRPSSFFLIVEFKTESIRNEFHETERHKTSKMRTKFKNEIMKQKKKIIKIEREREREREIT